MDREVTLYALGRATLPLFEILARYRLRLLLQEFDVPPGETVLGRSPECAVTIDDPLVSREHARIVNHGDRVQLFDLGSRNGSKVNGNALEGNIELKDGDRIRIGNQEILFTQVVAPRRPNRPTGSLRNCRNCHTPYIAEAPSCPHCGHVPGTEETLSGGAIPVAQSAVGALDRDSWSLRMQLELIEKALSLHRLPDADRVLTGVAMAVEERVIGGGVIDDAQLDVLFGHAVRLCSLRGDGRWLGWTLVTLQRMQRMPKPPLVGQITHLPPIVVDEVSKQLEEFVAFWNQKAESLEGPQMHALGNLAALRDEVAARRARQAQGTRGP